MLHHGRARRYVLAAQRARRAKLADVGDPVGDAGVGGDDLVDGVEAERVEVKVVGKLERERGAGSGGMSRGGSVVCNRAAIPFSPLFPLTWQCVYSTVNGVPPPATSTALTVMLMARMAPSGQAEAS